MDAIEFVKERNRMCSTYMSKRCEGCPADNYVKEGPSCIMNAETKCKVRIDGGTNYACL